MSDLPRALIERLVDALKGYFSITGLMLVGIYMIKSPDSLPAGQPYLAYIAGSCGILAGAIIGVWYSIHLVGLVRSGRRSHHKAEIVAFGGLVLFATVIILSIIAGAIAMSCGHIFG